MAGYPTQQMHRFAWTRLSEAQISEKLKPAIASGPVSASPLSDALAGKSIRIVTDKGPSLAYQFTGTGKLKVSENGARAVDAGYGALTMEGVTLFTHLVPGAQRGYAVAVDRATSLATVFELWFSGFEDKREVQREVWQGYVEQAGQAAPSARHATTSRVEGKGYWWKQDNGTETLEFFPSAGYSHFVELTRLGGELGYCAPSDYIRIDDERFIYARVEAEFSGILTLYVMDLNRIEQIGVRLGFDAADKLEYYLFRGHGEWLGQLATFEKFGDVAGNPIPPPAGSPKGARRVYRPLRTMPKMTPAQVKEAVAKKTTVLAPGSAMAGNGAPPSDWLAGKSAVFRYDDGPVMEYRFEAPDSLQYRKDGGAWTKVRYLAWESMPGVFLFGHVLEGMPDHDGHIITADFEHGLVTCFRGYLNTPYFANEAGVEVLLGTIEMEGLVPPKYLRHQHTDELLGRAITWNYSPGLTSMHLYSTPHSMSWIIFTDSGAGGMEWSGPAQYVKIRDGLYMMSWLEEACNGTLGVILINMRTVHDAGIGYHAGPDGLSMGRIGAHARYAGRFDVSRFYQVKT